MYLFYTYYFLCTVLIIYDIPLVTSCANIRQFYYETLQLFLSFLSQSMQKIHPLMAKERSPGWVIKRGLDWNVSFLSVKDTFLCDLLKWIMAWTCWTELTQKKYDSVGLCQTAWQKILSDPCLQLYTVCSHM